MGWSSWNTFRNRINEKLILDTAHAMKDKGLIDAGYTYINLDDCWQSSLRDENGELVGDYETFPSGIAHLAKEVNKLGLKLGAYTSNGTLTCEDLPASLGREQFDAYTLAKWGVEYFKYDYCHHIPISRYAPLVYSVSVSQFDGHPIEYSVHNAVLSGLARFMTDTKLPTGSYVSGLDANQGAITYNSIEVDEDGEYVLTINIKKKGAYEKYLIAKINDDEEYEILFPAKNSKRHRAFPSHRAPETRKKRHKTFQSGHKQRRQRDVSVYPYGQGSSKSNRKSRKGAQAKRKAHRFLHLRMGLGQAVQLGRKSRQSVAHDA